MLEALFLFAAHSSDCTYCTSVTSHSSLSIKARDGCPLQQTRSADVSSTRQPPPTSRKISYMILLSHMHICDPAPTEPIYSPPSTFRNLPSQVADAASQTLYCVDMRAVRRGPSKHDNVHTSILDAALKHQSSRHENSRRPGT